MDTIGAEVADLAMQITRFVDEAFPGFIACEFVDAAGNVHEFVEKILIVSTDDLWADTTYPRQALPDARC